MTTFDLRDEESTRDILAVAYQRAKAGVSVRILVDGFSGFLRMEGSKLLQTLAEQPNIEIRLYNPIHPMQPWKTQGRMHDKYIIVDDLAYILGGRNTFDYFIGDYPTEHRSLDREVLIYNGDHGTPAGRESSLYALKDYFVQVWDGGNCVAFGRQGRVSQTEQQEWLAVLEARYERLTEDYPELFCEYDYERDTVSTQGVALLSNPTGIYGKEPVVFAQMTELMRCAEEQVVIHSPYVVLNEEMASALESVTEQVPVILMVNAVENGDNVMASSDYRYHRGDVLDTGVKLLEYAGGTSYHGKSAVVDGEIALVGSYNLDLRSTYVDTELMVAVHSRDLAEQLLDRMETLHQECRQVNGDGTETVPEGLVIPQPSLLQRGLWRVIGFVMQPFRVMV